MIILILDENSWFLIIFYLVGCKRGYNVMYCFLSGGSGGKGRKKRGVVVGVKG